MLSRVGKTPQVHIIWFVFLFFVMHCALMLVIGIIGAIATLFVKDQYGTGYAEKGEALAKAYWPYLISDVSSTVFLVIAIGILAYLARMNLERRYNTISGDLIGWFVVTAIIFVHSSLNPIYLTHFSWDWWQYLLRLLPLIAVFYIVYDIIKIVNIELIKAYEADHKYSAEYRRNYLQSHHGELLSNESELFNTFNKFTSRWRLMFIHYACRVDQEAEEVRLIAYYREPILLLKLAQIHYAENQQSDTELSHVPLTSIEIPSTFDIVRIEKDIQLFYFDQELLKEYVYVLSTRFLGESHQDQLQEIISTYAIDTGLTIEQQNRIDTKVKWRQRQSEEQWKEAEENWEIASQERKIKTDDHMGRMRSKLLQKRASENNTQLLDELDKMRIEYNRRKSEIGHDSSLTKVELKEQLRILQQTYIAQIDDFGSRL